MGVKTLANRYERVTIMSGVFAVAPEVTRNAVAYDKRALLIRVSSALSVFKETLYNDA